MKQLLINFFRKLVGLKNLEALLLQKHQEQCLISGKILTKLNSEVKKINDLSDVEFKIFSQWGDDGIIQWLIKNIPIPQPFFIEFGVQNYCESNTRFLLQNSNWDGLVIDGSKEFTNYIKSDPISWQHNLKTINQFITRENIDKLLKDHSPTDDIGLLSIDIDGNDYWIWEAIQYLKPRIVICEYNGLFGDELALSIPYDKGFVRSSAHYSNLYFGTSIKALIELSKKKGYQFIGTNSNANNAYFIRTDLAIHIDPLLNEAKINLPKFRESRGLAGELTHLSKEEGLRLISDLPLIDTLTNSHFNFSNI